MEQQLINLFMKFAAKAGAGNVIRELVQSVDESGNPKIWNAHEIEHAVQFMNFKVETFGAEEAREVIRTLMKKYNIGPEEFRTHHTHEPIPEPTGVQGLQ